MIRDTVPSSNYYEATAQRSGYPGLQGELNADVCVVGGGIAGCSTALHLASNGYRVALLEAECIGFGASGRSGGQLLPGYSCGQQTLRTELGDAAAHQLWDMSVEAVQLAIALTNTYHIECDLKFGHIDAAIKSRHRDDLLRHQEQLRKEYGYESLRFVERDELHSFIKSGRYIAGLFDSAAAQIHPLNYTLGLAQAAYNKDALIFEHSKVNSIRHDRNTVCIRTDQGAINAKYLALCANVDNTELSASSSRIMPVATYMIATQELDPQITVMNPDITVSDCNFILDYFRMTQSRLLFGGGVSYSGRANSFSMQHIQRRMLKVFPQLRDAKIGYTWFGLLDITMNRAPDFGRIRNNVYYLQGFSGHGLALATLAGKLVAESIAMQTGRFDLFSQIKHRSCPGGPLHTPLLVLAMLWYRLRDLI